jgi:hypothetical protein
MRTLLFSPQYDGVDRHVQRDNQYTEADLYIPGETAGIQHRQQIALDEASSVHGFARTATKFVLQWSERAHPASELNQGAPHGRWYMHPGDAWPAQDEQTTRDNERNKREMKNDYQVREDAVHSEAAINR